MFFVILWDANLFILMKYSESTKLDLLLLMVGQMNSTAETDEIMWFNLNFILCMASIY